MQMRYKYFPTDQMYRWSVAKRVELEKKFEPFLRLVIYGHVGVRCLNHHGLQNIHSCRLQKSWVYPLFKFIKPRMS